MSADNWRVCPRCLVLVQEKNISLFTKAQEAYGKVRPEQYLRLIEEAQQARSKQIEMTLREDFQILTVDTGEFFIHYKCRCTECNFLFEYDYRKKIFPEDDHANQG